MLLTSCTSDAIHGNIFSWIQFFPHHRHYSIVPPNAMEIWLDRQIYCQCILSLLAGPFYSIDGNHDQSILLHDFGPRAWKYTKIRIFRHFSNRYLHYFWVHTSILAFWFVCSPSLDFPLYCSTLCHRSLRWAIAYRDRNVFDWSFKEKKIWCHRMKISIYSLYIYIRVLHHRYLGHR